MISILENAINNPTTPINIKSQEKKMIKGLFDGSDEGVFKLSFFKNDLISLPHHSHSLALSWIGFLQFGQFIFLLLVFNIARNCRIESLVINIFDNNNISTRLAGDKAKSFSKLTKPNNYHPN